MNYSNRRCRERLKFNPPLVGILENALVSRPRASSKPVRPMCFVDVHDISGEGALIETGFRLSRNSAADFMVPDPLSGEWRFFSARVIWTRQAASPGQFLSGLKLDAVSARPAGSVTCRPHPRHIDFLTKTDLLDCVPRMALCHLLNCLSHTQVTAGERFIHQGDVGESLYIVQEGTCAVKVELEGEIHQVARLREGDLVGEMAVLTGERRGAHVDAETDMHLWRLDRKELDKVSAECPELRMFLTELVTARFENSPFTNSREIGKYTIRRKLGHGGWSIVYEGIHNILNTPVAIKMMKHSMAMEPDFVERFRREAIIIARMNHENIVQVYDIEELYRTVFIIMEYLQGQALETILEHEGALSISRAVKYLVQTCRGLDYAHEKGIVHQDIKPANIFILPNDSVKLLDFGLARTAGKQDLSFLGTVMYTAPEQAQGGPVDARTDIYALGIMAYEMVAGKRPYPEDDLRELIDMHVHLDIPDPALAVSGLPETLKGVIIKACRRNPDHRYQSAAEILDDLVPLAQELGCLDERVARERRKMAAVHLSYSRAQLAGVNRALEDFSLAVRNLGANILVTKLDDF